MNFSEAVKYLSIIKEFILDILFPVECLGCGKEKEWICSSCQDKIKMDIFVARGVFLDKIIAPYSYDERIIKQGIHLFKYKFVEDVGEALGKIFVNGLEKLIKKNDFEAIVIPVPLHKKRLLERGFNQAEILASSVGNFFSWGVETKILSRSRFTVPQVGLPKEERMNNIKEAFAVLDKNKIFNKKIVLIDDVFTTGATMEECAKVLKEAGVGEIWGFTLAKG
ncbi:MAG TPA: ComF family protein [Patescibacteria group bacterium]|nr:ComF family protein [Patescibacteria group bacterium]